MAVDGLMTVPIQPWMRLEGTRRVMKALNMEERGCARFVGGCVRDALLGVSANDIDIATQLTPERVARVLRAAGAAVHATGLEHGTLTAVANGRTYEITTLRRDVETDGRRATVAFTTDWAEDAARRDFHMNALYCDMMGRLYDPTGRGLEDLRAGRVEFIGDADMRIREDYLRILRFFRFSAWFGRDTLSAEGLGACMRLRGGLSGVSAERIWMELKKLLGAPDPRPAVRAMEQTGILPIILPDAYGVELFEALVEVDLAENLQADPMLRMMSLHSKDEEMLALAAQRLRMSNKERKRLLTAASDNTDFSREFTEAEFRRQIYLIGEQTFRDRLRLAWAARGTEARRGYWRALNLAAEGYERPEFPICGDDVIAVGVEPGPRVGLVLRKLEAWWVEAGFPGDVAAVARHMRMIADDLPVGRIRF